LLWVKHLHSSQGSTGLPLTVLGVAAAIVIWHAGSLSDRRGRKFTLVPALLASAVTLVLLGYASTRWEVLALMAVLGVASAYSRPGSTSIVGDVATDEQRAVAVSGYRTAGDIGALLSPIVAGVIAETFGYRWAFSAVAAFVFLAFLTATAARETVPSAAESATV
jgi:MFS family permease